jgi:hypothetical protein
MSKGKSSLPFEVMGEKAGKSTTKRLTILVKPERVDGIIAAIRALHLEAVIYDVKSAGKEKEKVASGRGVGTIELAYTNRKVVAMIVDAGRIDDVVDALRNVLGGESKAVVVVAPVDGLVTL